jgi:glutamyl-tRNA reductase
MVDLEQLGAQLSADGGGQAAADLLEVQRIVTEEVTYYAEVRREAGVTPIVVALRDKAARVVAAELKRLHGRAPELGDHARDEVAMTVRRVVDKLLHAPTVRVRQLAQTSGPDTYAAALNELFELDPAAPEAVSQVDPTLDPILGPLDVEPFGLDPAALEDGVLDDGALDDGVLDDGAPDGGAS